MFNLTAYLIVALQLGLAAAFIVCIVKFYVYPRAMLKRRKLLSRLRAICRNRGWTLHTEGVYRSLIKPSDTPEIRIDTGEQTFAVKLFACLRPRDHYTLTSLTSHYTENGESNLVFIGKGYPRQLTSPHVKGEGRLFLPRFHRAKERYIKKIHEGGEAHFPEGAVPILCLSPKSVQVNVVRTNRPEQIFDGDRFCGTVVYSGGGLCRMLESQ